MSVVTTRQKLTMFPSCSSQVNPLNLHQKEPCRLTQLVPANLLDQCKLMVPANLLDQCKLMVPANLLDQCKLMVPANLLNQLIQLVRHTHTVYTSCSPTYVPITHTSRVYLLYTSCSLTYVPITHTSCSPCMSPITHTSRVYLLYTSCSLTYVPTDVGPHPMYNTCMPLVLPPMSP